MSGYISKSSSSELAVKLALFFAKEQHTWERMSGNDRISRIERILKDAETTVVEPVRTYTPEAIPRVYKKSGMSFDLAPEIDAARKKSLDAEIAQFLDNLIDSVDATLLVSHTLEEEVQILLDEDIRTRTRYTACSNTQSSFSSK